VSAGSSSGSPVPGLPAALPETGPDTSSQLAAVDALIALGAPAASRRSGVRKIQVLLSGAITGAVLGVVLALHVVRLPGGEVTIRLGWYGTAVATVIGAKLVLSLLARPVRDTPGSRAALRRLGVAGVITCCNEDPAAFTRCLDSVLTSTRLPDALTIIDDGSRDPACGNIARSRAALFRAAGVDYEVVRFGTNQGKREGLATGFRRAWDADVYLCIDSDTILHPAAIENALRPFARRRVQAVTGCVLAANRGRNLLTRLIDLRYAYAFLGERGAYSVMGSVLCACGSLALYRGPVVRKYLDDFLSQRFLGRRCTYGDDRRLTYYCLREGQVLLAPDAVAWTLVPERMGHFLRQQIRWSKSFFRESLWMLARMRPTRACWWLTLVELGTWCGFTTALIYSVAVRPAVTGHFTALTYLISALLLAYARSGHYAEAEHHGLTWRDRAGTLLLAPVYGLIHMTLLLPLRVVALATLRDNKWGTRKSVEVKSAEVSPS
jgi:hyaluronan synthase